MIIGAAMALVFVGVIIGMLLGRRRPAVSATRAVTAAAQAEGVSDATSADTEPSAGSLRSEQQGVTAALWRCALGLGEILPPIPAGHLAISSAAMAALQAEKLADRYFPRRPMLMPQLQSAVNSAASSSTRLADIIAQDPVLAGSILRLANSVFYRLSNKPVESIQRAVVVCGTDGLQSLAATALMQPVFSGGGDAHSQFPAMLWDRCTRASIAAEMLARRWCPADRQIAQLLALVAALGPLVVYRVVQDQYRATPALKPAPVLFLSLIDAQADRMSQRVAELWQSSPRMIAALEIAYLPGEAAASVDPTARPLADTLLAGELLAALSLLRQRRLRSDEECQQHAASAGVPAELFTAVWERLLRDAQPA